MSIKRNGDEEVMPDGRTAKWKIGADYISSPIGGTMDPKAYLYCDDCNKLLVSPEISCTCPPKKSVKRAT